MGSRIHTLLVQSIDSFEVGCGTLYTYESEPHCSRLCTAQLGCGTCRVESCRSAMTWPSSSLYRTSVSPCCLMGSSPKPWQLRQSGGAMSSQPMCHSSRPVPLHTGHVLYLYITHLITVQIGSPYSESCGS